MVRQQNSAKAVQCRIDSRGLRKYVGTISIFIQHTLQAANLSFNSLQTVHKLSTFIFVPHLFPVHSGICFCSVSQNKTSPPNTLMGYL